MGIGKLIGDIKVLIHRRKGAPPPVEAEDDDEEDYIEERKADQNPGKVKLNGGDYGKVFGINRKIVTGIILTAMAIVFMAFMFNLQEKSERARQPQQPVRQEEAATPRSSREANGYDELFRENQKAVQAKAGGQTQRAQQADPMARSGGTVAAAQPAAAAEATAQRVPALATPTYSVPYALPSAAAAPQAQAQPTAQARSEEKEKAKSMEERFKSAIAFALGQGTAASGEAASAEGPAAAQAAAASSGKAFSYAAPSDSVLQAGTLIPAMLFTGINTDIAGQVTAQVMDDVYDTATRTALLIPAGSQLIGSYEAGNASGNGRVSVTFSTIVLPDGGSYAIDGSMVAVDGAGYNGIAGKVNHHTGRVIGKGLLSSAMTALSTLAVDRVTLDMSSLTNMAGSAVKDTVTVEPGRTFSLYVTKPIAFSR